MIEAFTRRLRDRSVIIIDGGTGTELQARGVPMHDAVWAGAAVLEHAEILRSIHEDYIRAGAEVITANTFWSNPLALKRAGFGEEVAMINRKAVQVAVEARENAAERPVLIAGSLFVPPSVGDPAGGVTDDDRVLASFRVQAGLQAESGVDLFALEMIPDTRHGKAAVRAAAETGLPLWLGISSWSGRGEWVHAETLAEMIAELSVPNVMSINAMHIDIAATCSAIDQIRRERKGTIGAYAHRGEWIRPNWVFKDIAPEDYAAAAKDWVAHGAQIIGGCCGIGPQHIARLTEELPSFS